MNTFKYERQLIDYSESERINLRELVVGKKGAKRPRIRKDEYGVPYKGWDDYVIQNYGNLFKWTETGKLKKSVGSVSKVTLKRSYSVTRYIDGKVEHRQISAEQMVCEMFIKCNILPDKAGNICIWTLEDKKADNYAGHLYPCDRGQIEALRYFRNHGIEDTEEKIIEVIERGKYYATTYWDVGYIGEIGKNMDYEAKTFRSWKNMLRRCYDPVHSVKSYSDVTVCEEWLNFTNFYYWHLENDYALDGEDLQLDKDILIPGNRVYSPEACLLVPASVNLLFRRNNAKLTPAAIRRYIDMYRGFVPEKVIAAMSSWVERLEAEKSKVAAAE